MSSYEKAVKGATKLKLAPPKAKYIETLLGATRTGESGVAEVFKFLQLRLRDSTWTIAFKALIVVHLMIREGEPNVALGYVSTSPRRLVSVNQYTDVQTQGRNIRHYSVYIIKRAEAFAKAQCDYVADGAGRLAKLTIDKGLLKETEAVQDQIMALIKCDFLSDEMENEISVTAFRLLIQDLRPLFTVMNEGTMNVLEHYFEMSRPDAERALDIYKLFTKLTDQVIRFLNVARQYEHVTKVDTPKLKHAPTSLTSALEDYLRDPDFETNRRQYIATQQAKKSGKPFPTANRSASGTTSKPSTNTNTNPTRSVTMPVSSTQPQQAKGPPPDLMDFFDSIEQQQQPMASQPSTFQQQPMFTGAAPHFQQQTGFAAQPTGFSQQQTGFGQQQTGFDPQQTGFNPQQTGFAQVPQQQQNGGMPQQQTGNPFGQFQQQPVQPQQTGNPFQQSFQQQQPQQTGSPFGQTPQQQPQQMQPPQLQPQFTGAGFGGYGPQPQQNPPETFQPFPSQQQHPTGGLQRQATNPFRQSMLPNQTGQSSSPFGQNQSPFGGAFGSNGAIPEDSAVQQFSQQGFSQQGFPSQQSPPPFQQQQQQQPQAQPLATQPTGANPFARQQQTASPQPLQPQATGTNPFRQSQFINQNTGQGWQHANQGTFGGFNTQAIETNPVFPRPAGQQLGYGQQQQSFI